jgi:hypothetical protein
MCCIRLQMQDAMFSMIRRCYFGFYDFFVGYIPDEVEIKKCNSVKNTYADGNVIDHQTKDEYWTPKKEDHLPIFLVSLTKSAKENVFQFSTSPEFFKTTLLLQFTVPLDSFQDITDIEQKILPELFKNQKFDKFIKVPKRPLKQPEKMEFGSLVIEDENQWLFELHEKFEVLFTKAVAPLKEYIKTFDKYLDNLAIEPDEKIKEWDVDDVDQQCDLSDLTTYISKYEKLKMALYKEIPESIQVSCFQVNCKELLKILAGKYTHLVQNIKTLIAKRCRQKATLIFEFFDEMKKSINYKPKDVE